jgi:hypothetical protein
MVEPSVIFVGGFIDEIEITQDKPLHIILRLNGSKLL